MCFRVVLGYSQQSFVHLHCENYFFINSTDTKEHVLRTGSRVSAPFDTFCSSKVLALPCCVFNAFKLTHRARENQMCDKLINYTIKTLDQQEMGQQGMAESA